MQFSENNEYRKYFVKRFGISEKIMDKYSFWKRGKRVWAFSGKYISMDRIETVGIKALTLAVVPKPSTAFLRVVGKHAIRNVVYLTQEQTMKFLKGENIQDVFSVEQGYVVVRNDKEVLGCGLYKGMLINQLPKKYRMQESWV